MSRFRIDQRFAHLSPEQRERAQADLEAFQAWLKANPLLNFLPHAKQRVFLASFEAIKLFLGGNRSGKTTAAIIDDVIQAIDRDMVPDHLLPYKKWDPPFHCRIVTPDLGNTLEGVIFEKLRDYLPPDQLVGGTWEAAYDKQLRVLHLENDSWFQFLSNDQARDKHGGAALHRVHFDEEPSKIIYGENTVRLIDYDGDQLFSMTPLEGMTWMYDDIYEPWEKGHTTDTLVVTVDMDDNPHLTEAGKARALASYSGEERLARKSGRFVSFAGMIYPEYDKVLHTIEDRMPDPNNHIYVGIDPGMRGMAAAVFCELDPDNTMTVFHEIGLTGSEATAANMCRLLHLANMRFKIRPRIYIMDPAGSNKVHQTGRSDADEYRDQGIHTIPGQNSVRPGINNVKQRLAPIDPMLGTRMEPKLFFTESCTIISDEFRKYRWIKTGRSESDAKEEPVKKDDHMLDALRYVCMSRPYAPEVAPEPKPRSIYEKMIQDDMRRMKKGAKTNHPNGPGVFA